PTPLAPRRETGDSASARIAGATPAATAHCPPGRSVARRRGCRHAAGTPAHAAARRALASGGLRKTRRVTRIAYEPRSPTGSTVLGSLRCDPEASYRSPSGAPHDIPARQGGHH